MSDDRPVERGLHPWIVTVTEEAMGDMDGVRMQVEARGFTVDRVLNGLGQMSGRAAAAAAADVASLDEVSSVDPDGPVGLAPPDSGVQ